MSHSHSLTPVEPAVITSARRWLYTIIVTWPLAQGMQDRRRSLSAARGVGCGGGELAVGHGHLDRRRSLSAVRGMARCGGTGLGLEGNGRGAVDGGNGHRCGSRAPLWRTEHLYHTSESLECTLACMKLSMRKHNV